MDINLLAVALAALAAFFLGYLWYTIVFARPWQRLIGMGEKSAGARGTAGTPGLGRLLAGSLALEIVMAFVIAWRLGMGAGWTAGLLVGALTGALVACAFGVNYLFEGRPARLWAINAGYNLVVFSLMGAIIGAF